MDQEDTGTVTVSFDPEISAILRRFEDEGQALNSAIGRAISLYDYATNVTAAGESIAKVAKNGVVYKIDF